MIPPRADVVVAGGGTAGIAAAVAAARAGAETLLIERAGGLGGMAFSALVHTLCGLYRLRADACAPLEFANTGFPREFAERLIAGGAACAPVRMGRLDVLPHRPVGLARMADRITAGQPRLRVFFHTDIVSVSAGGGRVAGVRVQCRGREQEVEAGALVDASGDAGVSVMAGAGFEIAPEERLQRPAYIFGLGGVAAGAVGERERLRLAGAISSGVSSGRLPAEMLGVSFRQGLSPGEVWASIDQDPSPYDPCSPECLTGIEREGRRLADELVGFLRENAGGFSHAYAAAMPACAGIRESRRVTGEACLTAEAILLGTACDDPAAVASWPLELRETAKGPRLKFPEGDRMAGIPRGCLVARGFVNLFVAGRCISCTHDAQASIRVTGTCMATGEAAGRAAAAALTT